MTTPTPGTEPNAAQREQWNGVVGERWARFQAQLDRALEPVGDALLDRAAPRAGESVLDVGCGCGASTLALGERVGPRGRVVGLDLSAPMLARARDRAAGRANVRFVAADASAWSPEDGPFDLAHSRFGVMFFDDPAGAFRHVRTLLRPGGRVAFAAWRRGADNPYMHLALDVALPALPPAPPTPPDAPGPFAFAERGRIEHVLAAAGFVDTRIERFDAELLVAEHGLDEAVEHALNVGPLARRARDLDEATRARVVDAVRDAFAARMPADGVLRLTGSVWLVRATTPPA